MRQNSGQQHTVCSPTVYSPPNLLRPSRKAGVDSSRPEVVARSGACGAGLAVREDLGNWGPMAQTRAGTTTRPTLREGRRRRMLQTVNTGVLLPCGGTT